LHLLIYSNGVVISPGSGGGDKKKTMILGKTRKLPKVASLMLTAFLVGFLCFGCSGDDEGGKNSVGRAPDFSLKDMNGKIVRLSDLRGKVVLINFFATWCAPCRQEIPDFLRLYDHFKEKGFEIVGIGVDMEGEAALRPFSEKFRISYPIVVGTREVVLDYGDITGVPTSFFVDRQGHIAERFIGQRPYSILERNVTELLEKKK
jgi:cytochrome c biogenesis protein CcmG/thiol:disulfide interchange protein DsbE